MKKILLSIALLASIAACAQTWNIGSPNAADVVATLSNDTLYVRGTGRMTGWTTSSPSGGTPTTPWYEDGYATQIKHIVIEDGVTRIGQMAFRQLEDLVSVKISNSVTVIMAFAFSHCYNLASPIVIPDGIQIIEPTTFYKCYNIPSVTIPESVEYIYQQAFSGCSSLTEIIIPSKVKLIEFQAFGNCTGLRSVTNLNPVPQTIVNTTFDGVNLAACTLTVPCGSLSAYQAAAFWQDFGTIEEYCPPKAGVSNVNANFSCPGQVTVNYDLGTTDPVDVTLYYSPDGGKTWLIAQTVSGDLSAQETGSGKTIVWNNRADKVRWGKFRLKVEVPQPKPKCGTVKSSLPVGELTFLCYNLGADPNMSIDEQMAYTTANATDATVYGDLYQWGRPTDGHEKRTSGTTNTLSTTDVPGHPFFITPFGSDWRSPSNSSLWDTSKTANDPCPPGFRVPTGKELESIVNTNTWEWNNVGTAGYRISPDGGSNFTLFLPAAGYRSNAGILGTEISGMYWSSETNPTVPTLSFFTSQQPPVSPFPGITEREMGYSVRCIKEY
ncbi:MAG: leucine-rich repeat protein [Prevotellaceae bacterium]|nr:leucine-rich repeat protein [Prevotellaceae bacterium]